MAIKIITPIASLFSAIPLLFPQLGQNLSSSPNSSPHLPHKILFLSSIITTPK